MVTREKCRVEGETPSGRKASDQIATIQVS